MSAASPPGAVNTSPLDVALYMALADGRCAVANFSRSRLRDKVLRGSTLILEDTIISLEYSVV